MIALAIVTVCGTQAAVLRAGVAKADITPQTKEVMWGFEDRLTPANGTIDPLFARALVLEAGSRRLAVVTLDLGRGFGPDAIDEIRNAVEKSSGITTLLLSASHTHSAPLVQDIYKDGVPGWERTARDRIKQAIKDAADHLTEARIGSGTGTAYIGHNRLRVNPDGKVSWFERNPTQIPTSPVDPTVTVVRVDRTDGTPLAVIVNYACHPVIFGADNTRYLADYPAVMNSVVEKAMAAGSMSFFLQGAPGDINPFFTQQAMKEDALRMREWTGTRLGQEAARVAKKVHTETANAASIDAMEESLTVRLRWNKKQFQAALLKFLGPQGMEQVGPILEQFPIRVTTALINKQIAIATFPGEPFVDFQINWRDRCPVRTTLLAGYTNGYYGYFPTIAAAARGGYGAASASTWAEVGTGERIVDHAVAHIYEMQGRMTDLPDDLKGNVYQK